MDVREKLVEIVERASVRTLPKNTCHTNIVMLVNALIEEGVTVQECAYWQYIDDVDEDNNIQPYCSVCHAGDKHATSMIGKVPYCWKC